MLELRGLRYPLELVKEDRYHVYYNKEHNVTILAIPYCKHQRVEDIFNSISNDKYEPLIEYMNSHNNLIIKWTQVEATTSDYTIYCNADYLDYCKDWNIIDMEQYLWALDEGEHNSYKYNIVKENNVYPFFDPNPNNEITDVEITYGGEAGEGKEGVFANVEER